MAGEWREATVSEIASATRNALVGGPFGSNLVSRDYVDDGTPVIRGQNMGTRWVDGEFAHVTPAKAQALAANLARPGDIVFTQRGTLGQVSLVPDEPYDSYLVSQSQMKLSVDREIEINSIEGVFRQGQPVLCRRSREGLHSEPATFRQPRPAEYKLELGIPVQHRRLERLHLLHGHR